MSFHSYSAERSEKTKLVELRNGRLVLKQKLLSYEKMSETMQGACAYAFTS